MSTKAELSQRSHEENWLEVLELAVCEVFEIMLGARVSRIERVSKDTGRGEYTAMVGLAGALCGILTVECDAKAAPLIAKAMLGDAASSEAQVIDALGEICNMIAGNFTSGAAHMKASSQGALDRIAALLRGRDYRLRVEGHTDSTPIHTAQFSSNWELSTARATEIVRLLIARDGFPPERLSAAGYAQYHPVASNTTAEGRGNNRRVDIVVLGRESKSAVAQAGSSTVKAIPLKAEQSQNSSAKLKTALANTPSQALQH